MMIKSKQEPKNIEAHPSRQLLLAPLADKAVREEISAANDEWIHVDGEMSKVGTMSHSQLDFEDLKQRALVLLAEESKDIYLLAHMLNTLQYGSKPYDVALAATLLVDYCDAFWEISWPQDPVIKRRNSLQILQRFNRGAERFAREATPEQRELILSKFAWLQSYWQTRAPELLSALDALTKKYQRVVEPVEMESAAPTEAQPVTSQTGLTAQQQASAKATSQATSASLPTIDSRDERKWRDTLLQVADLLCQQQPELAIGYRLRRQGIWGAIQSTPQADREGRTPLAAPDADRAHTYQQSLVQADLALWQALEHSLTLAPYWFAGHHLSARIARQLDYPPVAEAIREEVSALLHRLPALRQLTFSDHSPFVPQEVTQWLAGETGRATQDSGAEQVNQAAVWHCFEEQGLEAALQLIEQHPGQALRDHFHNQLLSAQLLEQAGYPWLAGQHYRSLQLLSQQTPLTAWEPALFNLLAEKLSSLNKITS